MVVNLFLQSSALQLALSVICVFVFTGLTAYDTQRIVSMYNTSLDRQMQGKVAILGALSLYINFINIFLSLLRLFGDRR
jgi:FtsH-binding integral membrane protein